MVVASTVVFLQKVPIFGTSKNAMGQIHFFIFFRCSEFREFSRTKNRTSRLLKFDALTFFSCAKICDFSFDPLHVFGTCFSFGLEFSNGHKI